MENSATPPSTTWTLRKVALTTLAVVAVAWGFYILIRFRLVIFYLFTAIVLSTAFTPLVNQLTRWKIPRTASVILTALLALALLVVFILVLSPLIFQQGATLTALINTWYQQAHTALLESPSLLIRRIALELPFGLPLNISPPPTANGEPADKLQIIQQAITVGSLVLKNILTLGAVALLAGVWILEGERAGRFILLAVPAHRREVVRDFISEAGAKVGAYTRGLLILSLIVGGLSMVAYIFIGLPNVLLLGILAGIFEAVPLIGPLLAMLPAVLVAASTDPSKVIFVILSGSAIQILENNLIVPRVMDRAVGINPIAGLLAFLTFGSLFGFVGALLAIPLAALIQLILEYFIFQPRSIEQVPITGRSNVSMLRYEAQQLVQDVRKQVRDKESEFKSSTDEVEDSMEAIVQDLDSILAQVEGEQQTTDGNNGNTLNGNGGQT